MECFSCSCHVATRCSGREALHVLRVSFLPLNLAQFQFAPESERSVFMKSTLKSTRLSIFPVLSGSVFFFSSLLQSFHAVNLSAKQARY